MREDALAKTPKPQAPENGAAETPEEPAGASYASVVYVHGIGSQRRYEETSRLIDSLDKYLGNEHRRGNDLGRLVNIKPRIEPLRGSTTGDTITYIRAALLPPRPSGAGQPQPEETVRFYEIYWAPIMADAKSPTGVLKWVFRQALRPWTTLRSPWRERQRLRRSALVCLFKPGTRPPRTARDGDYDKLIVNYSEFEGLSAQRAYPAGTFRDYVAFIGNRFAAHPETAKRLQGLARLWRRTYWLQEWRNAFALASLALAMILLGCGVIAGALATLKALIGWTPVSVLITRFGLKLDANLATAVSLVGSLAGLLGLGKLLTDYMGDVEAWSTYEETDEKHVARDKVLAEAFTTLDHVLGDPRCSRTTIVAHSLGTSIAHDALLAMTRQNSATRPEDPIAGPVPLDKIEHFITLGSPIDKIEYFFESYASASHRYKRVVEALRGDIGTPPFSRNRKPHIHWINYWDLGDPISGSLDSPASASRSAQFIDNVQVASFDFPFPARSHAGYFTHRRVIGDIFRVIFLRQWSFETLAPAGPNQGPDYRSQFIGPGQGANFRLVYLVMAALLPWLVLAALVLAICGQASLARAVGLAGGIDLVLLAAAAVINRFRRQRLPI